jgi:saccharopine dehydrogenase-like NADP-dependent oxidoreductase
MNIIGILLKFGTGYLTIEKQNYIQMKHKVLILGAGMVVQPMVDYLLENNIEVTVASRTMAKAQKAIRHHAHGHAVAWTIDDLERLEDMIRSHDLVVSLLPYTHHVAVANLCIRHSTNMVTTSYVSDAMKALDSDARAEGIIIMNEIGVDPGYDHMTAMRIIDKVHDEGGQIEEFYSLCGALAAPEALNNPFNYKFSWSPKGVVMAGNNDARYLENGQEAYKPTEDLFKNPLQIVFPGVGPIEVYPNRNSLPYIDLYGIPEVRTLYRGTFRYKNWCETMDLMKALGLTQYDEFPLAGFSYSDFTAKVAGLGKATDLKMAIAEKFGLSSDATALEALDWLGLFSEAPVHLESGSPFDVVSDLMINKMMLGEGERDMVIMQHMFTVKKADGKREKIESRLLDFGDEKYTSIARTVALPAAIAVKMILDGMIDLKGVHIPIRREIYEPVLNELEKLGIKMEEVYGLKV